MIAYTVKESGWLWQNPDLEAVLLPATSEATHLILNDMHGRLAAHRGPGRYGHAADALRAETSRVEGFGITGRVFGAGPAKFKLRILNYGATGHPMPRIRARRSQKKVLKFSAGGGGAIFRRYVWHPGMAGLHFREETQEAQGPAVYAVLDRAVGDYVGR